MLWFVVRGRRTYSHLGQPSPLVVGKVAEHARDGEAGIGRTPQCRRRAIVVKALRMHRAMRL